MNKTLEYMAFELPVVAFDLKETRVSAGEAATYIRSGDVAAYARAIVELLDDGDKREAMGRQDASESSESWAGRTNAIGYIAVYDKITRRVAGARLTCAGSLERSFSLTAHSWSGG